MPRKPRKESSTQIYHVIVRGNNRQLLFLNDEDKLFFTNRIFKYSEQLNISIYSYCIMGNHVHILLGRTPKIILSLFVQKLANSYVFYFNRKYECSGHLFQGRFKSEPVESDEYFKTVLRYILQNPQKANIDSFVNYKWNSYCQLVNTDIASKIDRTFVYELFEGISPMKKYLKLNEKHHCMEYETRILPSDEKVSRILSTLLKIDNIHMIKSLTPDQLSKKLIVLRHSNFPLAQISRVTGLSIKILKGY